MSDNSRRLMRLEVPPTFFGVAIKGTFIECTEGLPEDCEFRGFAINPEKNTLNVFISHPSFAYVHEGGEIPSPSPVPTFKVYRGKELQVFKRFWEAAEKQKTDEMFDEEDESPF